MITNELASDIKKKEEEEEEDEKQNRAMPVI